MVCPCKRTSQLNADKNAAQDNEAMLQHEVVMSQLQWGFVFYPPNFCPWLPLLPHLSSGAAWPNVHIWRWGNICTLPVLPSARDSPASLLFHLRRTAEKSTFQS